MTGIPFGDIPGNGKAMYQQAGTIFAAVRGFESPKGGAIPLSTSCESLFSDDFGGTALDTANNWDVLAGGLGANPNLGNGAYTQAAIGTGVTGVTYSVASSALSVVMGTTASSELWLLSKQVFAGKEDIQLVLSKTQALAANHIWAGLVEVDATTLVPLLNANLANEFSNKGGCQFGLSATATAYYASAIGDSSPSEAAGNTGTATAWTTAQEALIEIDSRDVIVSTGLVDVVSGKVSTASRVSTQVPNDKKVYKLLLRFKNVSAPASSTTVTIARVLVVDNYELRAQVSTGEGDLIAAKALAANIVNTPAVTIAAGTAVIGSLNFTANTTSNGASVHKAIAAATTNATSLKTSAGKIVSGQIANTTASWLYFKLYNKASAPTVGTDTPVATLGIPPNGQVGIADLYGVFGKYFATGIAYAITGAAADTDTTAVTAGAVIVNLDYI